MAKTKCSVQHERQYARGGNTHMARPQSAGPQRPSTTAHAVKGTGGKSAKGGPHSAVPGRTLSAKAGRTRKKPRPFAGRGAELSGLFGPIRCALTGWAEPFLVALPTC